MSKNVLINDVEVEFPFEPYAAQKDYMESVVAALDGGKNGLLESPTGTGKTLCLLCAVLAWKRKHDGVRKRQVIYCSRTHSQLSQVIRELKKTSYAEKVSMSVLGSREHMCVNSEVLRLPSAQSQQSLCNSLRADKACRFYRSVQNKKVVELPLEVQVHDIEDLKVDAKKCGYCPYYFEREAAVNSDVVFLPYNYIFDKTISKQLPFKLDGSILIVDEAHNLPGVLSSTSCVDLHPLELANCIHECTRAVAFCEQKATNGESSTEDLSLLIEEFSSLKIVLRQLEESVEKIGSASPSGEVVHPGSFMHHFLSQVLITPDIYFGAVGKRGLNDIINSAIEQLALTEKGATGLVQFQRLLENAFNHELPDHSTKFIVRASGGTPPANETPKYILSLWFLDASFYLREVVANLHSFILTSGTLSPLDHFEAELGVPFQVQLKGRHVIGASQIVSSVLCRGPSNEKLNGSYAFRNSVDYQVGLGMTVVNLSRVTPGGSVVFFPSYAALNAALNVWKKGNNTNEKTVWGLLTEIKPVFVEPNTTSDLAPIVTEFQQAVDSNRRKGALFLAICRGKVSEGIDFSDHHGRSVMVTGIPFANSADLFVRLKRGYIDSISRERPLVRGKPFTGDDWYKNEAMRAVNQALGRVIRHKDDYGALLLLDERFAAQIDLFPEWISEVSAVYSSFRDCFTKVGDFFKDKQNTLLPPVESESPACGNGITVPTQSSVIPASSKDAALYARQYDEQLSRERLRSSKTLLDSVLEKPRTTPAIDKRNAPATPKDDVKMGEIAPATQRPIFARQSLHLSNESTALQLGSSSKEFCSFLKSKLSVEEYDSFRTILGEISKFTNTSSGEGKDELYRLFSLLKTLFKKSGGTQYEAVALEFGKYIPASMRLVYSHYLRKRAREI